MVDAAVKKDTSNKKTGSWRTINPVITKECIGCGICVQYCPENCIVVEKKAKINYDYCKGCLICMNQCPKKAIKTEG